MKYARIIFISIVGLFLLGRLARGVIHIYLARKAFIRGSRYISQKNYRQALVEFTTSLKYLPRDSEILCNRSNTYDYLNDFPNAVKDANTAILYASRQHLNDTELGELYFNRGVIYGRHRHYQEAIADYQHAIHLKPEIEDANAYIADILAIRPGASREDGIEAIGYATKACEQTQWKDSGSLNALAAAYARAGDFEKAVRWQQKAISKNHSITESKEYQQRLQRYQDHQAFTDTSPNPQPLTGMKML